MSDQVNHNDFENELNAESNNSFENINKDVTQTIEESEIEIDTSPKKPKDIDECHELDDNQDSIAKTNEDDNIDQTNSNKSRELKSLLALSKEANLDTNIAHKRKEVAKKKDNSKNLNIDSRRLSKGSQDNRFMKFPVTAEAELEQEMEPLEHPSVSNPGTPKSLKRHRDSSTEMKGEGVNEESAKKNRKIFPLEVKLFKVNKDIFCWRCHREGVNIACETCPRSYHQRCLKQTISNTEHWPCPECVAILKAESTQTRSEALRGMTLEHLCNLLKFAVSRMIQCQGSEPFLHPVSDTEFPEYKTYIIQPMDLAKIEENIKNNFYGSTQAFEADAKWLLHNSIIFNSSTSKLTYTAKNIIKVCKQEMAEIENCPTCYLNANTKKSTWFVEVCPKPHLLVWAKLKGFPYWPAKVMSFNPAGMVDVRFFGAHDRAWVHYKECYLYSEKDPNTFKQKRFDIEKCIEELDVYVENLKAIFGEFKYAPYKTFPDPNNELKLLQIFLPKYKGVKSYSSGIKRKHIRECLDKNDEQNIYPKDENDKEIAESDKMNNVDDVKENKCHISNVQEKYESQVEKCTDENPKKLVLNKNDSYSNMSSPQNKDECSMEGYGTDDDTSSEINLEKRKELVNETSKFHNDEKMEEEVNDDDEDDTQVPNNIALDKTSFRGATQHQIPGKIKTLARKSDADNNKPQPIEDNISPQKKSSRRNSDQSVKSDSSRLSNISDKINKVEFSEDMEVTLGNDDGCVNICENISPTNGESSKSESDSALDNKRKPVQVDIDNAEFTISPASKLKIADKLIKRLSDSGSDQENRSEDGIKKSSGEKSQNIPSSKSQTDILIEKFKDIIEHKVVNFNETSSKEDCCETVNISDEKNIKESESSSPNKCKTTNSIINSEIVATLEGNTAETNKEISITSNNNENDRSEKDDKINNSKSTEHNNEKEVVEQIKNVSNSYKDEKAIDKVLISNEEILIHKNSSENLTDNTEHKKPKIMIQSSITDFTSALKKKDVKDDSSKEQASQKIVDTLVNGVKDDRNKNFNIIDIVGDFDEEEEEDMNIVDELTIDKNKIFNIIHSSLNEKSISENRIIIHDSSKDIDNVVEKNVIQNEVEPLILSKSQSAEELMKRSTKQFHTYSNIKNKLKQGSQQKIPSDQQLEQEPTSNSNISDKINESEPKSSSETRKRKYSSEDNTNSQAKHFKLVSIEKILNKDLKEGQNHLVKVDGQKEILPENSNTNATSLEEILIDDIKSEPNSEDDDDFNELENLEAKKQYLSALNISEKTYIKHKQKENEIRTRAKAVEKRERFRIVDNLTRVIDDVALNYSAKHEGEQLPSLKQINRRKSYSGSIPEGEIYVKSFAKIKDISQSGQQRARKSFPAPMYIQTSHKPIVPQREIIHINSSQKEVPRVINSTISTQTCNSPSTSILKVSLTTNNVTPKTNITTYTTSTSAYNINNSTNTINSSISTATMQKSLETPVSTVSHVILFPASNINYGSPIMNSVLGVVPSLTSVPLTTVPSQAALQTQQSILKGITAPPNVSASQNYIPQSETRSIDSSSKIPTATSNNILNNLLEQPHSSQSKDQNQLVSIDQSNSEQLNPQVTRTTVPVGGTNSENAADDEFALLNSLIPENVSRAVSDLLLRPPPRLKPRPPGVLHNIFDEGVPSSAGNITTRINSIAHRMGDYFRGMLIETLEDLGKDSNPEAKIVSLQQELETVKYKHNLELAEIRKNICTILKDIQKSITEEREKVIDETRAACEAETIKRIELAKSKQWCANCSKEAQFYCCWNTSYCDYPCQQKHWPQHMGKCTQNIEKANNTSTPSRTPGQPVILRQTGPSKSGMGPRIIAKPTKVYMNKASTPQKTFKTFTSTGNNITVIETTPGNYELVSNGSIRTGKIISTSSNIYTSKFKNGNVLTMSSPSSSGSADNRISRPIISNSTSNSKSPAIVMPVQTILEEGS